jgi:uncharacterized protein YkwD
VPPTKAVPIPQVNLDAENLGPEIAVTLRATGEPCRGRVIRTGHRQGEYLITRHLGPPPAPALGGPAASFLAQLNIARAHRGLTPVGYDGTLESACAAQNAQCHTRGFAHHVFNPPQCVAAGSADPLGAWLASPAHAAAILAPGLRAVAFASDGYYSSVSLR